MKIIVTNMSCLWCESEKSFMFIQIKWNCEWFEAMGIPEKAEHWFNLALKRKIGLQNGLYYFIPMNEIFQQACMNRNSSSSRQTNFSSTSMTRRTLTLSKFESWCKQFIFNIIIFYDFLDSTAAAAVAVPVFIGMLANVYVCFVREKVKPKAFTSTSTRTQNFTFEYLLSVKSPSIHWQNFNEFPKPFSLISQFRIVFFCYYGTLSSAGENEKSKPLNDFCVLLRTGSYTTHVHRCVVVRCSKVSSVFRVIW